MFEVLDRKKSISIVVAQKKDTLTKGKSKLAAQKI